MSIQSKIHQIIVRLNHLARSKDVAFTTPTQPLVNMANELHANNFAMAETIEKVIDLLTNMTLSRQGSATSYLRSQELPLHMPLGCGRSRQGT